MIRTMELKIIPIGKSKGVRLPTVLLDRYAMNDTVIAEAHDDGILLRRPKPRLLDWEETFKEASREREDWSDFDVARVDVPRNRSRKR